MYQWNHLSTVPIIRSSRTELMHLENDALQQCTSEQTSGQ